MSSCHFLTFTGAFYAGVFRSLLLIVLLLLTNTWYMLALSPDSCGLFAGLRRLGSMCSGEDNSCHSSSTPFMAKKTDWLDSFAYYDTEFNMNFCISVGTGNWCFGYGLGYGDTDEESSELYLFISYLGTCFILFLRVQQPDNRVVPWSFLISFVKDGELTWG